MGSDLITLLKTPYNRTAVQNVSIGIINRRSSCNKSDEISDVVKDMDLDAQFTWLAGNVSDQEIVGQVTPTGYSLHHAEFVLKVGEVGSPIRYSLKCGTYLHSKAKSSENYQLTFVSGG